MKKLVSGVQKFRSEIVAEQREFFERLGQGQSPHALFITCSDSRINPNLVTQTPPGDLFIVRNAGNLVPPYGGETSGAEAAAIEFAIDGLGIEDVIVCGHSHCGAMKALFDERATASMPALRGWLSHAETTRRLVTENYPHVGEEDRLNVAVQENVLNQIANLRTHPVVAARLAANRLRIHAWVYKITTGEVFAYDRHDGQFVPLTDLGPLPIAHSVSYTAPLIA